MIELNTMEIDGKTYFEIETIKGKENEYIYYGNEDNTEDYKIYKLKDDDLLELNYDEINEAFTLFNEKHRK